MLEADRPAVVRWLIGLLSALALISGCESARRVNPSFPLSMAQAKDDLMEAYKDPRILADLAKRLRGETPYTTEPAAPLPE